MVRHRPFDDAPFFGSSDHFAERRSARRRTLRACVLVAAAAMGLVALALAVIHNPRDPIVGAILGLILLLILDVLTGRRR